MNKILLFEQRINREIELFCQQFPADPIELYEPIRYVLTHGGKRARPLIVLSGCDLFGGNIEQAIIPALGIEFFHNFTLIHDDLMDNAPLRRNRPTVHEKWNKSISVLSGDAMLVEAYQLLSKTNADQLARILPVFNTTAMQVCEGQQMDMNYEKIHKISIAQYLKMIELKTAALIAASFKIGALIGGAREEDAQRLYDFGKNLGIAFQIQDDLLDVYGDEKKVGKQKGGDIIANKKTYLLTKAMTLANSYTSEELNNWIQAPNFDPRQKVEAVTAIYNFLNIHDITVKEVKKYNDIALSHLEGIPVNGAKKEELLVFAQSLASREK